MTPKNFNFQIFFNPIFTPILMSKKSPLTFFKLKRWNSCGLLCGLASEALQKAAGTKKTISRLFHQYSWNSEVETTWKSLICWRHRTSTTYLVHTYTVHSVLSALLICPFFLLSTFVAFDIVSYRWRKCWAAM